MGNGTVDNWICLDSLINESYLGEVTGYAGGNTTCNETYPFCETCTSQSSSPIYEACNSPDFGGPEQNGATFTTTVYNENPDSTSTRIKATGKVVNDKLKLDLKDNVLNVTENATSDITADFSNYQSNTTFFVAVSAIDPNASTIANRFMIGKGFNSLQQALFKAGEIPSKDMVIRGWKPRTGN